MTAMLGGGRGKIGGHRSVRGTLKAATWACLAGAALTINIAALAEPITGSAAGKTDRFLRPQVSRLPMWTPVEPGKAEAGEDFHRDLGILQGPLEGSEHAGMPQIRQRPGRRLTQLHLGLGQQLAEVGDGARIPQAPGGEDGPPQSRALAHVGHGSLDDGHPGSKGNIPWLEGVRFPDMTQVCLDGLSRLVEHLCGGLGAEAAKLCEVLWGWDRGVGTVPPTREIDPLTGL